LGRTPAPTRGGGLSSFAPSRLCRRTLRGSWCPSRPRIHSAWALNCVLADTRCSFPEGRVAFVPSLNQRDDAWGPIRLHLQVDSTRVSDLTGLVSPPVRALLKRRDLQEESVRLRVDEQVVPVSGQKPLGVVTRLGAERLPLPPLVMLAGPPLVAV